MAETLGIRAVLFAKYLERMTTFYSKALGMENRNSDEHHAVLRCRGFDLIIHKIPDHIANGIEISEPPVKHEGAAIRLDFSVESADRSRSLANFLGGRIDEKPAAWAERNTNFYLGYDPEGNVFGVSEQAAGSRSSS